MLRFLFFAFVFFSPFTAWCAVSGKIRLPIILLVCCALPHLCLAALKPGRLAVRLARDREDILLLVFAFFLFCSFCLGFGGARSFNHLSAFYFAVFAYYVVVKEFAREAGISASAIMRVLAWSATACVVIIIADFALLNATGFTLRKIFLTGGEKASNMLYFNKGFFKVGGGTAEEPGSMALLLNVVCPLGICSLRDQGKRRRAILLSAGYAVSLVLLMSTAGVVCALAGLGLIGLARATGKIWKSPRLRWRIRRGSLIASVAVIALAVGTTVPFYSRFWKPLGETLVATMRLKVALSRDSASVSRRLNTWTAAIREFRANTLWGMGPGYGKDKMGMGYHSFFLTLLADSGIFSAAAMVVFLGIVAVKLLLLPAPYKYRFFIPFFGCILHLNIIGDFYHAPFWVGLVLIQLAGQTRLSVQTDPAPPGESTRAPEPQAGDAPAQCPV